MNKLEERGTRGLTRLKIGGTKKQQQKLKCALCFCQELFSLQLSTFKQLYLLGLLLNLSETDLDIKLRKSAFKWFKMEEI